MAKIKEKTFLVDVSCYKQYLIDAETEEEAMDIAHEEGAPFDWELHGVRIEKEIEDDHEFEQCKRFGAEVL